MDGQIAVTRDASNNVVATVKLMKDGKEGAQIESRLEVVEIGDDEEGDKITSCVIVPADGSTTPGKKANRRKPPTGAAAKTALAGLHEAIGAVGAVPPRCDSIPGNVKCVKVEQWRTCSYMKGVSTSKEPRAKQKAFKLGSESLIADGHVAMWGDFVWPCRD